MQRELQRTAPFFAVMILPKFISIKWSGVDVAVSLFRTQKRRTNCGALRLTTRIVIFMPHANSKSGWQDTMEPNDVKVLRKNTLDPTVPNFKKYIDITTWWQNTTKLKEALKDRRIALKCCVPLYFRGLVLRTYSQPVIFRKVCLTWLQCRALFNILSHNFHIAHENRERGKIRGLRKKRGMQYVRHLKKESFQMLQGNHFHLNTKSHTLLH